MILECKGLALLKSRRLSNDVHFRRYVGIVSKRSLETFAPTVVMPLCGNPLAVKKLAEVRLILVIHSGDKTG